MTIESLQLVFNNEGTDITEHHVLLAIPSDYQS